MSDKYRSPDTRELSDRGLPEADFPAASGEFRVYFEPDAHEKILAHAEKDKSVELGGVLAGTWQRDKDGPFVAVRHVICSQLAASGTGEVTFTHDAWAEIHREMDGKYPDLAIVGWYHTHPDFGVFLSERDRFIHEHFFGQPGQIALVVDPVRNLEGVFVWRNGKTARCPHYWIGKRVFSPPRETEEVRFESPTSGTRPADSPPSDAGPARTDWLLWVLATVLFFMLGFMLADLRNSWNRARLVDGVIAHFGTMKVLRPGLRENLALVESEIGRIEKELAAIRSKDAGEESDARAPRDRLPERLQAVKAALGEIREMYGFDDLESEILARRLAESFAGAQGGVSLEPAERKPRDDLPEAGKGGAATSPPKPAASRASPTEPAPPVGQTRQESPGAPESQKSP